MTRRDLESQILEYLDGRLSPEHEDALVETLLSDADALELYRQHAILESAFHRLLGGSASLAESGSIAGTRLHRRVLKSTLLAAAAIVAISLIALRLVFVSEEPELPTLTFRTAPDTIIELTHPIDGEEVAPGTMVIGSNLAVAQGTTELNFASGVRCVVQAPTRLTLSAEDRVLLKEGTAWFHVPSEASGFRVSTAELDIVDLGTEFGVEAKADASHEVHVFQGSVRARSLNGLREEATLVANQARLSKPAGRLEVIEAQLGKFLTTLPSGLPHLYFSFDHEQEGTIEVAGPLPDAVDTVATLRGPDPGTQLVPGVRGKALALRDAGDWVETNWPGFAGTTPRSVAFWLRIPKDVRQPGYLPAIVGWGEASPADTKWKITVAPEGAAWVPRLSFGAERFDGDTPLNDGRWHHVAFTYSGETGDDGRPEVAIFVDGQRESLQYRPAGTKPRDPEQLGTVTRSSKARPLRIGVGVVDTKKNSFHGDLDELHIFEGVISPETIRSLSSRRP